MNPSHDTTNTPATGCPSTQPAPGDTYADRQQRRRVALIAMVAASHEAGVQRRREHDASDPCNPWVRIQRGASPGASRGSIQ